MKKKWGMLVVFIVFTVSCLPFANASPMESTLDFDGDLWYLAEVDSPPYGEAFVDYQFDGKLPGIDTKCHVVLDVSVWVYGEYSTADESGIIDFTLTNFIIDYDALGFEPFAMSEVGLNDVFDVIAAVAQCGMIPYMHQYITYDVNGNWDAGELYLALNAPVNGINSADLQFGGTVGINANPVPEPASMFLLGCGLIGLACFGRKKIIDA